MALVALFLIGLPYIMTATFERSGNRGAAEAWTAMVPALLGLTTMTISGIFVFMTFRIDRGAKAEARAAAEKIAKKSVDNIFKNPGVDSEAQKWRNAVVKEMDQRLKEMDQHMEARENKFVDKMDQQIKEMEAREGKFVDKMDQGIKETEKRMEARENEFVKKLDQWLEARDGASDQRMAMRVSSIDERLKERFDDADGRLKERFDDADKRINEWAADTVSRLEWRFDWLARNTDE